MARTNDLTQGSILKKLLAVAVPVMGTQLLQMLYNLTDMFWLGQLKHNATTYVAASGYGGMFLWLSMAFMLIGRMGSEIGVSQNLGRGEPEEARGYAENATRVSVLLGVAFGAVMALFPGQLIQPFGIQEASLFEATVTYMRIVSIGVPLSFVTGAVTGAFNGAGNSHLSFWCNAIGLAFNLVFDPLMIYVFGWGIAGAAISTVIGQGIVCVMFLVFVKRHKSRPFHEFRLFGALNGEKLRQIFRWSAPVGLESGLFTLLSMVVTGMTTAYGEGAVAVQRVGSQIESLSWLIGGGFSSAITSFVGQNFGAGRWMRIRKCYRISLFALLGWEVLVTLVLVFLGRWLFALFLPQPELYDLATLYMRTLAICQVFCALEGACAGTFRGMGKTMPPSACSIFSNIVRVPMCYLLGQQFGLFGLWLGISISAALRGILVFIWYTVWASRQGNEMLASGDVSMAQEEIEQGTFIAE